MATTDLTKGKKIFEQRRRRNTPVLIGPVLRKSFTTKIPPPTIKSGKMAGKVICKTVDREETPPAVKKLKDQRRNLPVVIVNYSLKIICRSIQLSWNPLDMQLNLMRLAPREHFKS